MQVVFYHQNCNDGLVAAHSVWAADKTNTLCIPITYDEFSGQTPDEFFEMCFTDKIVRAQIASGFNLSFTALMDRAKLDVTAFLVDISVPKEILRRISETFSKVVVLDHHESANKIYQGDEEFQYRNVSEQYDHYLFNKNVRVFMDRKYSGAHLAWHFMNHFDKEPPRYISLVSDYDTWNKSNKDPDYFAAGLRARATGKFRDLDVILNEVDYTLKLGKEFDRDREGRANGVISRRVDVGILLDEKELYKGAIVNSNMDISSVVGNNLVTDHGYDVGLSYVIVDENTVAWSIRSKKPFSCLFVAEYFGGGGHAQACGFSTSLGYLVSVLATKTMRVSSERKSEYVV